MTDKEVRAIAIKEVTYADMIAIGATEEIATVASWKARCAFEASWDCAVDKACELIEKLCDSHNIVSIKDGKYKSRSWLEELFRKEMEV